MKKIYILLLAFLLLPFVSKATTNYFTYKNMWYAGDPDAGTCQLVSVSKDTTAIYMATGLVYNGVTYKVTGIAPNAFTKKGKPTSTQSTYDATTITKATLPSSLITISDSAFYGCTNMTTCSGLTITNTTLTSIGAHAFEGCAALTSITIPKGVTSIGDSAFYGCSALSVSYNLTADASTYSTKSKQFYGIKAITFYSGVTSIPNYICYNNTSLQTVGFSTTAVITSIGNYAFYRCTGLTKLALPSKAETIGTSAFYGTSGITGTITIPASVKTIKTSAFSGCRMRELTFTNSTTSPSQLTSVASSAFYCTNLKYIDCSLNDPSVFNSAAFSSTIKTTARFVVPIGLEEAYHKASATSGFTYLVATGTLGDIIEKGIVGGDYQYHYRVTKNTVGIVAKDGLLYVKDINLHEKQEQGDLKDYPGQSYIQSTTYDESNWVAVSGIPEESLESYIGNYVSLNTLTGILTNATNPALTFVADYDMGASTLATISLPTAGAASAYTKNTFIPANFVDQSEYFFVKPKANEVAHVKWAVYGGDNNFYITAKQTNESGEYFNGADIKGGFTIGTTDYTFTEGTQYEFDAVITKAESSAGDGARRKAIAYDNTSLASDYVVCPIVSTIVVNGDNLSTGITDVNNGKQVASRAYYNLTGAQSNQPFSGVNIMVTTYTDGTSSSTKVLK